MSFKKISFFLIAFLPLVGLAQDSLWKKMKINEDLEISIPGEIDSLLNFKQGPHVFTIYSGTYANSMYMVQFTQKAGFNIHDAETYDKALISVQEGITKYFNEKNIIPATSDTVIHDVKMKTLKTDDPTRITGGSWNTYIFILNDRLYNIGVVNPSRDASNERDLSTFINSMQLPANFQEKEFPSLAYGIGYNVGKLIGGLIVIGAIGLIIYLIVRRI